MRFSLKDILLSVTFASIGMASLSFLFTQTFATGHLGFVLRLTAFVLHGPMFGAAIGQMFHRTAQGIKLGLLSEFALLFGMLVLLALFSV